MIPDKKNNFWQFNKQRGSALYYAVVVLSILLTMILGLSSIITSQVKSTKTIEDSFQAFYAADSGMEEAFYQFYNGTPINNINVSDYLDLNENGSQDSNEPAYSAQGISSPESIKSTGTYHNTKRAIQVSF